MSSMYDKLIALGFNPDEFEVWADPVEHIKIWRSASPQPTQAQLDAVTDQQAADAVDNERIKRAFELSKKDKVLIRWIAQKTNTSIADAKAELRALWASTP